MVDVATKETERIKLPKLPGKMEKDYGALVDAWSPDGLWVVHSKGHFHLMDPKTKETRKLNEQATGFFMGSVRVSPDGKKMLYLSATVEREWSLCVLDLLLGKTTVVAKMANTAEMSAAWSPDSRNIVCSHAAANAEGRADGEFHVEIFTLGDNRRRTLLKAAEWLTVTDWR
jgi:Tol biopolymer transport system component